MHIREASIDDIPGILRVLKASLGETSSKKTEEVWRYKHLENPFGQSLVLIAEEAKDIIGVRAFMRWTWQHGETLYSAFRAVDTATHPDHQGKGIFKKLTLRALEIGKDRGYHFVFNTPNDQSKPGYLKMGWKQVGMVKTTLVPVNPFNRINNKKQETIEHVHGIISPDLLTQWNFYLNQRQNIFTPKSVDYLKWRYLNNPLQMYMVEMNEGVFVAGYIKKHKKFKELRISEIIITSDQQNRFVKKRIRTWAKEFGANIISFSPSFHQGLFRTGITGNFGPALTFMPLNQENENQEDYLDINFWEYSLGDLELF